jgi:hypothetical protein
MGEVTAAPSGMTCGTRRARALSGTGCLGPQAVDQRAYPALAFRIEISRTFLWNGTA